MLYTSFLMALQCLLLGVAVFLLAMFFGYVFGIQKLWRQILFFIIFIILLSANLGTIHYIGSIYKEERVEVK